MTELRSRPPIIDNDALVVFDIMPAATEVRLAHSRGLLVGVGSDFAAEHRDGRRSTTICVRRGRVFWVGQGETWIPPLLADARAVLVDIRELPRAPEVMRTFGEQVLLRNDHVCVYEERLAPSAVRTMHTHGGRLQILLSDVHARSTRLGASTRVVSRPASTVLWNGDVVSHAIENLAATEFWVICVEAP